MNRDKVAIAICVAFMLSGCGQQKLPQNDDIICEPQLDVFQDSHMICGASEICASYNYIRYYKHLCFCDILCICFYSESNCDAYIESCDGDASILMLFGKEFCDLSKSYRRSLVSETRHQMEGFISNL